MGRIDYRFSPEIRAEFGHAEDIGEARANSVTGKRAALLQEYVGYIQRIAPNCSSSSSSTLRADSNIDVQYYHVWVDGTACTIRQSDLLVAEFGHNMRKSEEGQEIRRAVAARERPDEAEVGLRLDLGP